MRLNPYINALLATTYIASVAFFMQFISGIRHDTPDTIIDGVAFLSLFVFSTAVMAFLFFYRPTMLVVDGKPKEAMTYFLKTLATFGVTTLLIFFFLSTQ